MLFEFCRFEILLSYSSSLITGGTFKESCSFNLAEQSRSGTFKESCSFNLAEQSRSGT